MSVIHKQGVQAPSLWNLRQHSLGTPEEKDAPNSGEFLAQYPWPSWLPSLSIYWSHSSSKPTHHPSTVMKTVKPDSACSDPPRTCSQSTWTLKKALLNLISSSSFTLSCPNIPERLKRSQTVRLKGCCPPWTRVWLWFTEHCLPDQHLQTPFWKCHWKQRRFPSSSQHSHRLFFLPTLSQLSCQCSLMKLISNQVFQKYL